MNAKYSEEMKQGILMETAGMRAANKIVLVSGKRFDIPAPDRSISIVYYEVAKKNAPLILGFHGGGYVFGGNALNDAMWSAVADKLEMNVASVEYRKSPDHRHPAALDDAYDALTYFQAHGKEHGYDPCKILVMGCSAGANLAATLCIYAKQKGTAEPIRQILLYPWLDLHTDPDSKGRGSLEGPLMYLFNDLHCSHEEAKLSVVSPVFAQIEELRDLPEAVFCMADNDNLKAEGYRYAEMLREAGIKTIVTEAEGMPHGFFESGFGTISDAEMAFLGEEVQQMVREGIIAKKSKQTLSFVKECLESL